MGRPCRILVAGNVTLDRYGPAFVPGGPAYYTTRTHLGLGAAVRVATSAAADFPRDALRGAEVDVAPSAHTTTFTNSYGPGGARSQRVDAAAPPVDPGRVPPGWRAPDVLHLAPVLGELDLRAWLEATRARVVGLCVQGCVRALAPGGEVTQPRWDVNGATLRGVHAACVGEDDLRGQGDLLDRLAAAIPVVAFTQGARGCELLVRGRARRVGVFPAREVEPTGAGDVFAAALFQGLAEGLDPVESARLGAAAASIVIEARAGEALGRIGEARARAAAVPVG